MGFFPSYKLKEIYIFRDNHVQNIVGKFTKLSKIGVPLEFFTTVLC